MENPTLSIVVPCYNAEKYIGRCIESILNQSFEDFELIVVNDGSHDNSESIIKNFADQDCRIKYLSQENGGASNARNHGIEIAKGDWITFVDADDYIKPSYLSNFFDYELSQDTIYIQGFDVKAHDYERHERFNGNSKRLPAETALSEGKLLHHGFTWGRLYNAQTISEQNIRFNETISYKEDLLFMLEYINTGKYVQFIPKSDYIYCYRPGTLSSSRHSFSELQQINDLITCHLPKSENNNLHLYIRNFRSYCLQEMLTSIYSLRSSRQLPPPTICCH